MKIKWPWKSKAMIVTTPDKAVEYRVPSAVGELADYWFDLNARRKELNHQADALETEEKAIKEFVIAQLPKTELARGIIGTRGMFTVTPGEVYTIDDPAKLTAYVVKNKATDLFQRRLNVEAIEARVTADGEKVLERMGIARFPILKASVKAAPKKR